MTIVLPLFTHFCSTNLRQGDFIVLQNISVHFCVCVCLFASLPIYINKIIIILAAITDQHGVTLVRRSIQLSSGATKS